MNTKNTSRTATMKSMTNKIGNATSQTLELEPGQVAVLRLRLRMFRALRARPLKKPIVQGTLKMGEWEVTLDNPYALGCLARIAYAKSIRLVSPCTGGGVKVEAALNEELQTMLLPMEAAFVASVRDGFLNWSMAGGVAGLVVRPTGRL